MRSALTSLEPGLGLVDDIDPAFAPDELVVAVATAKRFQRVTDFHNDPVGLRFGRVLKDPGAPVKHPQTIAKAPFRTALARRARSNKRLVERQAAGQAGFVPVGNIAKDHFLSGPNIITLERCSYRSSSNRPDRLCPVLRF